MTGIKQTCLQYEWNTQQKTVSDWNRKKSVNPNACKL